MEHYCAQDTLSESLQGTRGSWHLQHVAAFGCCQQHIEELTAVSPAPVYIPCNPTVPSAGVLREVPWGVIYERLGSVLREVVSLKLLVGCYSRPRVFCWGSWEGERGEPVVLTGCGVKNHGSPLQPPAGSAVPAPPGGQGCAPAPLAQSAAALKWAFGREQQTHPAA